MRIPNKFNGYSRDGVRLYNDPATATVAIASMGEGAAIAGSLGAAGLLGTVGTSMLGAGALAEGAALGSALFGTGLSESGIASLLPGQVSAATAPAGVAANFSAPSYLSQLGNAYVAPAAEAATPLSSFQAATNQGILGTLQPAQVLEVPVVNPVATMQAPVSAVPEAGIQNLMQGQGFIPADQTVLSNAAETYRAAQPVYSEGIQSLAQGRGFPTEVVAEPIQGTSEMYNAGNVFRSGQVPTTEGAPSLAQGRGFAVENISRPEMSIDQFRLQDYPGQYGRNPIQTDIINERVAGMQAQNGYLNPIDKSIQEEAIAKQFGAPEVRPDVVRSPEVVTKAPTTSPTGYDQIDKATSDKIAQSNRAMQNRGMTGSTWEDFKTLAKKPSWENIKAFASENPYTTASALYSAYNLMRPKPPAIQQQPSYIRPYLNTRAVNPSVSYYTPYSGGSTAERTYFTGGLEALPVYRAAAGGLASLAVGGPVEQMSAMNAVGENTSYPQADLHIPMYSNPEIQRPISTNVIKSATDTNVDPYTGEERFAEGGKTTGGYEYSYDPKTMQFTQLSEPVPVRDEGIISQMSALYGSPYQQTQPVVQKLFVPVISGGMVSPAVQAAPQAPQYVQPVEAINIPAYQTPEQRLGLGGFYDYMNQQLAGIRNQKKYASGGMSSLGGYSDGGRLLRGPGDGVSDSIPASIGNRQPARLADGEFVVPARIVSEIGNGSTEAGARKLYAMMDRVQRARKKSVGKERVAVDSKADRYLPA